MNETTILVVDDESQMRKMIRTFLENDGYIVIEATDGVHALSILKKSKIDLLLVDIMMPFMDGFTLAKEVKAVSSIPIIFLTAKSEEWDKIYGLKLGGDDYIVKPFSPGELLARIESVLRRTLGDRNSSQALMIGPLVMNEETHTVKLDGQLISLTPKEFSLLLILAKNCDRVYTREQLLEHVWNEGEQQSSGRTVDTHIKTLRLKMGDYGKLIKTIWGVGYKFEV